MAACWCSNWRSNPGIIHAGETFGTEDPRTGEVYAQVAEAQEADVDAAVKAAREVALCLSVCVSHWCYQTIAAPSRS